MHESVNQYQRKELTCHVFSHCFTLCEMELCVGKVPLLEVCQNRTKVSLPVIILKVKSLFLSITNCQLYHTKVVAASLCIFGVVKTAHVESVDCCRTFAHSLLFISCCTCCSCQMRMQMPSVHSNTLGVRANCHKYGKVCSFDCSTVSLRVLSPNQ
jgi:hypothetical protein